MSTLRILALASCVSVFLAVFPGFNGTSQGQPANAAQVGTSGAAPEPRTFWMILFEKNPGLGTVLLSSFLLPIIILFLNNIHTAKIKGMEDTIATRKIELDRGLQQKQELESHKRSYENTVHCSLAKLLFEVQRLHVELSAACTDYECVDRALKTFHEAFSRYQAVIADNQLYLSSDLTDHLYSFYAHLSDLLIELHDIRAQQELDLALVAVHTHSEDLANELIAIQQLILKRRSEPKVEFDPQKVEHMRHCCGHEPTDTERQMYIERRRAREERRRQLRERARAVRA